VFLIAPKKIKLIPSIFRQKNLISGVKWKQSSVLNVNIVNLHRHWPCKVLIDLKQLIITSFGLHLFYCFCASKPAFALVCANRSSIYRHPSTTTAPLHYHLPYTYAVTMSVTGDPSTKLLRSNSNNCNGITNERVSDAPSSQLLEMLNLRLQEQTLKLTGLVQNAEQLSSRSRAVLSAHFKSFK